MPIFFVDKLEPTVTIFGEDASHISRSLRLAVGELVRLADGKGLECCGKIISCHPQSVVFECDEPSLSASEPKCFVRLYQAMPKGDKAETIIQKSVELGISEVTFFLSSRCISRPNSNEFEKKLVRYKKIATEAAKQCGRGLIPTIKGILSFEQVVSELSFTDKPIVFYEGATQPLKELLPASSQNISIVVGSEGGFSAEEIEKLKLTGASIASLGARILRCETAPLAALSAIMFHFDEF